MHVTIRPHRWWLPAVALVCMLNPGAAPAQPATAQPMTAEAPMIADSVATPRIPADSLVAPDLLAATSDPMSPRSALWHSALIPGWGQLRGGHRIKSLLFGGAALGWATAIVVDHRRISQASTPQIHQDRVGRRNTRVLWYVVTATAAALDAYVDTHLEDFDVDEGFGVRIKHGRHGQPLAFFLHRF